MIGAGLGLLLGGLGGGLLQTVSNIFTNRQNVSAQEDINKRNIEATRAANDLSRQWSLDDWNRQNAYNSPLQQMNRLREAGLNPALVYGNGAQAATAMVKTPTASAPTQEAPRMAPVQTPDIGSVIGQYYQLQSLQADVENKKAQNRLLNQEYDLRSLDFGLKDLKQRTGEFSLGQSTRMADVSFETAVARKENILANTDLTKARSAQLPLDYQLRVQQLKLMKAKTSAEIQRTMADTMLKVYQRSDMAPAQLEKMKAEISNLYKSGQLRDFEIALRAQGLNPSDPAYMRILVSIATKVADYFGADLGALPLGAAGLLMGTKSLGNPSKFPSSARWRY